MFGSKLIALVLLGCLCTSAQQSATLHLRGTVSDAKSRRPVPGARVSVAGGHATHDDRTDTNGSFDLPLRQEVRPGERIRVRVEKEGYESYDEAVAASDEIPFQVLLLPKRKSNQGSPTPQQRDQPSFDLYFSIQSNEKAVSMPWGICPGPKCPGSTWKRPPITPFMVYYGDTLYPIDFILKVRLGNRGTTPLVFGSYAFDVKRGKRWIRLCPVEPYNIFDTEMGLDKAVQLEFNNTGLSEVFSGKSLRAGDPPLEGWALFEDPERYTSGAETVADFPFRIAVSTMDGYQASQETDRRTGVGTIQEKPHVFMPGTRDLSKTKRSDFLPNCGS